jgi:hypothetical protein
MEPTEITVEISQDSLFGDTGLARLYDQPASVDRYCARLERALQVAYPDADVSVTVRSGSAPTRVYLRLDRTDLPATAEQARIERALVERVTRQVEAIAEHVRIHEADAWLVEVEA